MKGIIRILEAITASIIILGALTFFFNIGILPSDWSNAAIQIRLQDGLGALTAQGKLQTLVLSGDTTAIKKEFEKFMPPSADYAIRILGLPKPRAIAVGCLDCTVAQREDLSSRIASPLKLFDRSIVVSVATIKTDELADNDMVYVADAGVAVTDKAVLSSYIASGGSLVLQADLNSNQIQALQDLFNMSSTATQSGPAVFPAHPTGSRANKVARYFTNLTGTGTPAFEEFSPSNVRATTNPDSTLLVAQSNGGVSFMQYASFGKGHALWIPAVTAGTSLSIRGISAAAILLASEDYSLEQKAAPAQQDIVRVTALAVTKNLEVFEVEVVAWKVFY